MDVIRTFFTRQRIGLSEVSSTIAVRPFQPSQPLAVLQLTMPKRAAKRTLSVGDVVDINDVVDLVQGTSSQSGCSQTPTNSQVRKKSKQSKSTKISNDTTNDTASHTRNEDDDPASVIQLRNEISNLKTVIKSQSDDIAELTAKLSYIMKYLELTDNDVLNNSVGNGHAGSSSSSSAGGSDNITQSSPSSFAGAVKSKRSPPTARAAAVAAVYVEQNTKKRRSSSLVVSGLQPAVDMPDRQLFIMLCEAEFNICPDVISTKRLGQPRPGSIQPVLVTLRDEDTAALLIERARTLRQSTNPFVRSSVFINANLTRAEASAAYQIRKQRREAAQKKKPADQQSSSSSNVPSRSVMSASSSAVRSGPSPTACTSSVVVHPQANVDVSVVSSAMSTVTRPEQQQQQQTVLTPSAPLNVQQPPQLHISTGQTVPPPLSH